MTGNIWQDISKNGAYVERARLPRIPNPWVGKRTEGMRRALSATHTKQSRSRPVLTRETRLLLDWHNVLGWTITAIVCLSRDGIELQVAPTPSTGNEWPPAGTVQRPFICESFRHRHQVRPVTVWAEARQISSQAIWTLNAMANTGSHGICRRSPSRSRLQLLT